MEGPIMDDTRRRDIMHRIPLLGTPDVGRVVEVRIPTDITVLEVQRVCANLRSLVLGDSPPDYSPIYDSIDD